jgi:hypothetical protein
VLLVCADETCPLPPTQTKHSTTQQLKISYEEDFDLAVKAGCNAFRLSIEWARIEPRRGYTDLDAVARCALLFVVETGEGRGGSRRILFV